MQNTTEEIHLLIADVFWRRITYAHQPGELSEEFFPRDWSDKLIKLLDLWHETRNDVLLEEDWQEIGLIIESNKIQALTSPNKWIREYCKIKPPHIYA